MSEFSNDKYKELREKFTEVWKRIEPYRRRNLTEDEKLLGDYRRDIVDAYNNLVSYICDFYSVLSDEDQKILRDRIIFSKEKVVESFQLLNLHYEWPEDIFSQIVRENISQIDHENSDLDQSKPSVVQDDTQSVDSVNQNYTIDSEPSDDDMALTKAEYMTLMAQQIPQPFTGEAVALKTFINSVDYLKEAATGDQISLLKSFILTKLQGKALEIIPEDANTIDAIINALKAKIKPENSKVIEGRMMALRADKSNLQDYAKRAENLADCLKRSLILEGISVAKAQEMVIDKTIELCRANTTSPVVISILESAKFENAKEVVAKYIIQSNKSKHEQQILSFQKRQNNNNNQYGNRNNNNFNRNRQNFNRRSNSNGNNNYRNANRNNSNNQDNQNNSNNNYRGNNNYNNRRNNRRQVNVVENAGAPQRALGDAQEE